MKKFLKIFRPVYDNSVDALIPEKWALEGLVLLQENMVLGNLVNRNYKNEIADYGQVVNIDKPAAFTAKRKGTNDDVTVQNANATTQPVALNQHLHTTFLIRDSQMTMAFKDLVAYFLRPAIQSIASGADKAIAGFIPQFIANNAGNLDGLTGNNSVSNILSIRKKMNDNKVPLMGRNFLTTTATEATLLGLELFTAADKVGDQGTALREASLGRKLGFDFFMGQNTPYVQTGLTQRVLGGEINNASGYAIGSTTLVVDGFSAAILAGSFLTIEGSMYPYVVSSTVGGATPTQIVLVSGLRDAVVDNADIVIYTPVRVDLGAGYADGYVKEIHIDGFTSSPQIGQILRSAAGEIYTIMEISNNTGTEADVLLNRPLAGALADDAILGVGPGGSYNFAFTRDALALVNRPLALPMGNLAVASVQEDNGLSLRVTITYDGVKQGHLVTVDMLMGVAVLDAAQGAVLLA
ncbi:MAG TPA: P22 phage major capsid protein family protein [Candidatus Cloacimonadota bacterium]|nr:P22 phage major capsid protein family protein [Candidatus Cloacimonadota bacterium]